MTREQRKWAAARRAQFALRVALDRIDYMEDVLKPELAQLGEGSVVLLMSTNAEAAGDALAEVAALAENNHAPQAPHEA